MKMETLNDRITNFLLRKEEFVYKNPHGVILTLDPCLCVLDVTAIMYEREGPQSINLELYCEYETVDEFCEAFSIDNFPRLGRIRPKDLECLYGQGKASYWCFIDDYYLQFRKKGNNTEVEDHRGIHYLAHTLCTQEEIIRYTRFYYGKPDDELKAINKNGAQNE